MDFVEQLKSQVSIVNVIGEYVRLKRATPQRYTGLCPFHTEKTPSFSVNLNMQRYKCFGCGAGGDMLTFIMEIERLPFYEALKLIAERNGIAMPKRSDPADPESRLRAALLEMHEIAANLFRDNLRGPGGAEARAYLDRRKVSISDADQFGMGYSDRGGQQLLKRLEGRFPAEQIRESGLVQQRDSGGMFDRFRGRLMFPIHNESGKVIGFGGRALHDEDPKYLNSAESPLYRKSYVLYNLHRSKAAIRQQDQAVLVEGYMDVIGVYAAGVHQVVASCGTALTPAQVKSVKRHSERIVVNFDPDPAGARAAERSMQMLLDEGMHVRVLELEGGLDPDEYVKERGAEAYQEKLNKAPGYFIWLADRARKNFNMNTAEGKMEGLKFLLPTVNRIHDPIERATVAEEVAAYLGIERGVVLDSFRKSALSNRERQQVSLPPEAPARERLLLRTLLESQMRRAALIPRLAGLKIVARLTTGGILQAILDLHRSNPNFTYTELEEGLESQQRALLASALFADSLEGEALTEDQAEALVAVFEREEREARLSELRAQLRQAERSGDLQAAFRLMEEMNGLRIKAG